MEASISRLGAFDSTVTSQFSSVQNLIPGLSLLELNLRDDINRLRSANLYSGCTEIARSCTMSISRSSTIYWRSCITDGLTIDMNVSS